MKSIYVSQKFKGIWTDYIKKFSRKSTVKSYESELDALMNFAKKDVLDITEEDADAYYKMITDKLKGGIIKASTHSTKVIWLHSVFSYLEEYQSRYDIEVWDYFKKYLDHIARVSRTAPLIPIEDIDKIFSAAEEDLMDYCILMLMFRSGLTSSEISDLRPENIVSYDNGTFLFQGTIPRLVPDDVTAALDKYYSKRSDVGYLFYSKKRERLNAMYYTRMLRKYCDKAGVKNYTCREIRNTCGAIMFSYGVGDRPAASQMGITTKHIKRYKNTFFKEKELSKVANLVKINVKLPE